MTEHFLVAEHFWCQVQRALGARMVVKMNGGVKTID